MESMCRPNYFTNVSGTTFAGKFVDPNAIVGDYAYNIASSKGDLYVTYAPSSGAGGYIDEFDTAGNFIDRIYTDVAGTNLTQPYGLTIAPAGFGSFRRRPIGRQLWRAAQRPPPTGRSSSIALPTTAGSPGTLAGTLSSPEWDDHERGHVWLSSLARRLGRHHRYALLQCRHRLIRPCGLFGLHCLCLRGASASVLAAAPLSALGAATISGIEGNPLPVVTRRRCARRDIHGYRHSQARRLLLYGELSNWGDNTSCDGRDPNHVLRGRPTARGFQGVSMATHTYDETGTYGTIDHDHQYVPMVPPRSPWAQAVIADAALTASSAAADGLGNRTASPFDGYDSLVQ